MPWEGQIVFLPSSRYNRNFHLRAGPPGMQIGPEQRQICLHTLRERAN